MKYSDMRLTQLTLVMSAIAVSTACAIGNLFSPTEFSPPPWILGKWESHGVVWEFTSDDAIVEGRSWKREKGDLVAQEARDDYYKFTIACSFPKWSMGICDKESYAEFKRLNSKSLYYTSTFGGSVVGPIFFSRVSMPSQPTPEPTGGVEEGGGGGGTSPVAVTPPSPTPVASPSGPASASDSI